MLLGEIAGIKTPVDGRICNEIIKTPLVGF